MPLRQFQSLDRRLRRSSLIKLKMLNKEKSTMTNSGADPNSPLVKPNTNANDAMDTATEPAVDPEEIAPPKGADELRSQEAPENEAATKRQEE